MSSIAVKITADQTQLETQLAIARANTNQFTSELNKLARQVAQTGAAAPELTGKMQELAAKSLAAKSRVAELKDTLGQTRSGFTQFGAGMNIVRDSLGALGFVASAGALIGFGQHVFQTTADLDELAMQAGISTEALQAYRVAMQQSGISAEESDKLIGKLTRTIGEATVNTGKQRDAFVELGLGAKDLAGGAEGALPKIAAALLKIEDPARRARLEADLFGRSGQKLESALRTLAEPTSTLIERYKAMGLVLGKDLTEQADHAADTQTLAWTRVKNNAVPAIVVIGNSIGWLTGKYADFLKGAYDLGDAVGAKIVGVQKFEGVFEGKETLASKMILGKGPLASSRNATAGGGEGFPKTAEELAKEAAQARQIAAVKIQTWEQAALRHIQTEQQTNNHLLTMGAVTIAQFKARAEELENDRYRIAVEGADRRMKADKGDPVAYARDLAQKETLAQEHQDRLLAIEQNFTERKRQMEQSSLQDYLAAQSVRLTELTEEMDEAYSMGEIGASKRHQLEAALTAQIHGEVLKRLDAEIAGLGVGTQAYDDAMRERARLEVEFGKRASAEAKKTANQMRDAWAPVLNGFQQVASGIISSNASMGQILIRAGDAVLQSFVQQKLQELSIALFTETAKTDAEIAGAATRQTVQTAALSKGIAAQSAAGSVSIMNDAYQAAAGAYKAVVGIPVVGPFIAPVAAATAFGAVAAFNSLTSFDVGTNYVPTNMVAQVHKGERIIPEADNRALMRAVDGGGGPGRNGDVHLHIHPTGNNMVIDGPSVRRWFQGNSRSVAAAARTAMAKLQQ